eukprot:11389667-Ditylum_brightwellii.AAC.1
MFLEFLQTVPHAQKHLLGNLTTQEIDTKEWGDALQQGQVEIAPDGSHRLPSQATAILLIGTD